ncbi:hypothetical protein V8F33_002290 [Rhypophila sp. PSN 637]
MAQNPTIVPASSPEETKEKVTPPEPRVSIYVGPDLREFSQSKLPSYIWRGGLDWDCMVCGSPFVPGLSVPIRTIGFEYSQPERHGFRLIDITQTSLSPHPIRIHNRHLAYFIPFSHAWHETVAQAQDRQLDNIGAAWLAYQTPVRTLVAADKSVPQWQRDVQQQLLLSLPAIYNYTQRVIMHLDDAYKDLSYKSFLKGLTDTIRSRWFDRLKEVLILTEDASQLAFRIDDIATKYIQHNGNGVFMTDVIKNCSNWARHVAWTDMEAWKGRPDKDKTFGGAIYIMGMKQCRDPRDKYISLGGMIGLSVAVIAFDCFFSMAIHALASGDYTPLLLNPISNETSDSRAPWLPHSLDIIKDGVIQPQLESVGVVEWFERATFEEAPEIVFTYVAIQILRSSGAGPVKFWPIKLMGKGCCHHETDSSNLFSQYPALRQLLESFSTLMQTGNTHGHSTMLGNNVEMLDLAREMIKLLQLDRPGKQSADSRMSITHHEAQWYLDRYDRKVESLCRVRCKFCAQRSLFRLVLWKDPVPEVTQVYRIPGLLFDETIPEGVGLVVTRGAPVGKMLYGTPACACHKSERVNFGPAILGAQS